MEHFSDSEFFCPCGCGLSIKDIDPIALEDLQAARKFAAVPFIITSSIRCPEHNRSRDVGGSKTSSHLIGCAFDIHCVTSRDRMRMIKAFLTTRLTRIGIGNNFIHVDCDPGKPGGLMWTY